MDLKIVRPFFFFIPPTMIIPGSNPGEILMEQLQIGI